jgi:3',5'-cyclic AMP phosphodiesterase CpdA
MAALLAISDLHVGHVANRRFVECLAPASDGDWLIVAGDVGDSLEDVEWALELLSRRFSCVIWTPGNHELVCPHQPDHEPRGERRYRRLIEICRRHGVLTPEDPYAVWQGDGGPTLVAPLFLLYDYSFGAASGADKEASLRRAYDAGVVCVDEFLLDPAPFPSREAWCQARVEETDARLADRPSELPTVLVNHFPLTVAPTRVLRHPEFAQWCGTHLTADWHTRFGAKAVVYGHLHIPRTTWEDGVRFEEVSLGYPREPGHAHRLRSGPRRILPEPKGR